jgi:DNA-directed RNA polymerase specialized sigma24 family protein
MQLAASTRACTRTDTEALAERLYAVHRPRLLAIARRNSDDPEEAEEALHDAFRPCFTLPSLSLSLIKQSSLGA